MKNNSVKTKCVVLGIGNPLLGDDGVGIHVVRELQKQKFEDKFQQQDIEFLDGGTLGYLLINYLENLDALIVVDATNLGKPAGMVEVISQEKMDEFLGSHNTSSVHEV